MKIKYLSPLLLVALFTSCDQSDNSTSATTAPPPDTISAETNAVIEMSEQASIDAYEARELQNNIWRYDVPMPGNTYRNTISASLKANDVNAYLKLVYGKDVNMAVLLKEEGRFYEDKSQLQDIIVKFDSDTEKVYTCSVDPLFGFLIVQEREQFIQRLKQSHKVVIEAVTKETVQRTEYRKSVRRYTYRNRRRSRNSTSEIVTTQIENTQRTWEFNSSGLVWDH